MANLAKRFSADKIYTYIGEVLVSVNPYKHLPIYTPETIGAYKNRALFEKVGGCVCASGCPPLRGTCTNLIPTHARSRTFTPWPTRRASSSFSFWRGISFISSLVRCNVSFAALAGARFTSMRRSAHDTCVVISGESGAGKVWTCEPVCVVSSLPRGPDAASGRVAGGAGAGVDRGLEAPAAVRRRREQQQPARGD